MLAWFLVPLGLLFVAVGVGTLQDALRFCWSEKSLAPMFRREHGAPIVGFGYLFFGAGMIGTSLFGAGAPLSMEWLFDGLGLVVRPVWAVLGNLWSEFPLLCVVALLGGGAWLGYRKRATKECVACKAAREETLYQEYKRRMDGEVPAPSSAPQGSRLAGSAGYQPPAHLRSRRLGTSKFSPDDPEPEPGGER